MPKDEQQKLPVGKLVFSAVALTVGVCGLIYYTSHGPSASGAALRDVYVYDLSDGSLTTLPPGKHPPFDLPNRTAPGGGPAGVLAHVFACADCRNPKDRFIGYLETNTIELRDKLTAVTDHTPRGEIPPPLEAEFAEAIAEGRLVASPDTKPLQWVKESSAQGATMLLDISNKCSGGVPMPCNP